MKLYKAQVCPFSDESKVAKFLFPSPLQIYFSPFYGGIETCCLDLLHQFMSSPFSSLATDHFLLLFLLVVYCCCFAFTFGCGSCGVNYIGECCESVPWNHTGSYILLRKLYICCASARPPAFLSTMPHIPSSLDGMRLMEP